MMGVEQTLIDRLDPRCQRDVSRFVGLYEGLCKNGEPTVNPSTVPQDYRGAGLILE